MAALLLNPVGSSHRSGLNPLHRDPLINHDGLDIEQIIIKPFILKTVTEIGRCRFDHFCKIIRCTLACKLQSFQSTIHTLSTYSVGQQSYFSRRSEEHTSELQ